MNKLSAIFTAVIFLSGLMFPQVTLGQFSAEMSGIISSDENTPFWLQSNRYGIYSNGGNQFLARFQYHDSYQEFDHIKIYYGTSFIVRPGDNPTVSFNQGYMKIQGFGLELAGGRFIDISPIYSHKNGMGSLGVSSNAAPIPKIKISITDWSAVPFTNNFIQFQGYVTYGWLGSERYTDDVLLHEKAGYLKFGGDFPVNIYGGLVHYVQWGGNHPKEGDIPHGFSEFLDVFFAKAGDESTPGIDQAYVLGNQLGTWAFGSLIDAGETDIKLYFQSPIETKYDLKFKNMQDFLTGISMDFGSESSSPIRSIVYEFLYTKDQGGPRRLDPEANSEIDLYRGNQNYYNHQTYRTGWAYQHRSIGNPLFKVSDENLGILNNRIVAHHVGFESGFDKADFFGKITYSRNYGKRCDNRIPDAGEQELFGIQCDDEVTVTPGQMLEQWSFLAGTEFPLPVIPKEKLYLRIEAAFDNGRIFGNQFGILTSIIWSN